MNGLVISPSNAETQSETKQIRHDGFPTEIMAVNTPRFRRVFSVDGSMSGWGTPRAHVFTRDYLGPASTASLDPPRPAKDGHEWVWFPEGYWAEREYRPFDVPSGKHLDTKLWKRRKQSRRSHSGSSHDVGPLTASRLQQSMQGASSLAPLSPYLSEEAHVHSLQQPPAADRNSAMGERYSSDGSVHDVAAPAASVEPKDAPESPNRRFIHFPSLPWHRKSQSSWAARHSVGSSARRTSNTVAEEARRPKLGRERNRATFQGRGRVKLGKAR
ncbi:hypothetical protein VTK26DRAFT_644 [Humicola hyalothermophila]